MSELIKDSNGQAAQCFGFPVTGTTTILTLTTASTAVATAALTAGIYRVLASADMQAISGVTPVATALNMPILQGVVEYFSIPENNKVSAISTTAGATLTLTRMA